MRLQNPDAEIFKCCPHRKRQQKTLWEEVRREAGRGKNRFKIRGPFADERCSKVALDFFVTTNVRGLVQKRLRESP